MIRYLFVLYLGLVSVLLVDPNPIYSLPLVLVLLGMMYNKRWIGVAGIFGYSVFTIGNLSSVDLTDIGQLSINFILILVPLVFLLELVISPRPYRIERVSIAPIVISGLMLAFVFIVIFLLSRVQMIGIYLTSDPILQVFIIIALSILVFGPPLLSSSSNSVINGSQAIQKGTDQPNE